MSKSGRKSKAARMGVENQPVSSIEWRHRDDLYANDYNPNNVFGPEMKLLEVSLLDDGWTLPLVIRPDGEIVDGFHRWTLSARPDVYAMTAGMVPCSILDVVADRPHQMASTIRYNRARGIHHVVKMADIVTELKEEHGLSDAEIARNFGMEEEEIVRLYQHGSMMDRQRVAEFGDGWVPSASDD